MPQVCRGTDYRTDRLAAIAQKLNMAQAIDTLLAPSFHDVPLAVAVTNHRVTHIGFRLFSPEQQQAFGTTVCNFIERYLLELSLPLNPHIGSQERMSVDGVAISPATTATAAGAAALAALCADTTVSIHTQMSDAKGYTMAWQRSGQTLCAISFPVEYNLLMGVDMDERERRLSIELARFHPPLPPVAIADSMSGQQLRKAWNDNYYTLQGGSYLLDVLTANTYYEKDSTQRLQPIFRSTLPVESLANLFVMGAIKGDYDLQVRLRKYGFKTDTLHTTPSQWLAFCRDEGCKPYFGLIDINEQQADCELIMHCTDKGFNHVMRLTIPLSIITNRKGTIEARLNAYVNSSRIKNLFEEYKQ